jgi:hypothetical protein
MPQRLATRAEIVGETGTPGGVAPALNAVSDADLETWSEVAALVVAPQRWRQLTSRGHALLTAHFLASMPGLGLGPGGSEDAADEFVGPTTAMADGPASRSFGAVVSAGASADPTDASLATTPYGRAFLVLRRAVRGFMSVCVANGVNRVGH